jgi:hypothetical protein
MTYLNFLDRYMRLNGFIGFTSQHSSVWHGHGANAFIETAGRPLPFSEREINFILAVVDGGTYPLRQQTEEGEVYG